MRYPVTDILDYVQPIFVVFCSCLRGIYEYMICEYGELKKIQGIPKIKN